MKQADGRQEKLTSAVERENRLGRAAARDQVGALVHKILSALRRGEPVDLPGLGKLVRPLKGRAGR